METSKEAFLTVEVRVNKEFLLLGANSKATNEAMSADIELGDTLDVEDERKEGVKDKKLICA